MNKITIFILTLFYFEIAIAKDLGIRGNTFQIKEEGFLAMIQRKLKNVNMVEHEEKMKKIVKKKIEEPEPVDRIEKTKKPRNFSFDPTYEVKEDIKLPNGEVLYKAGTRLNPLDYMSYDGKLFFIDSRDRDQIKWLKHSLKNTDKKKWVVLVAGRPLELAEELGMDIYFDQFGELTKKFGIMQVPSTVEQEQGKKVLMVKEIFIDNNN